MEPAAGTEMPPLAARIEESTLQSTGVVPTQEDTNMRTLLIAGLMLSAALGIFAGVAQAGKDDPPGVRHRVRDGRQAPRVAEAPAPQFRIHAYPVVRDCIHVMFPQCSKGYYPLNDGTFERW